MRQAETQIHLTQSFMAKVRMDLRDPNLTDQRIRRSYKRVHELTAGRRQKSWKLLPSLCEAIISEGGSAFLNEKEGNVTFCGIMPSFCRAYVQSELFFPVVSIDGSFSCSLGRGVLLSIVTLTGSRHILPLAWAWAVSESLENVSALINLFSSEERKKIASIISDEGSAILASVRRVLSEEHIALCAKHREAHVSTEATDYFWRLVKASTPAEYADAKLKFQTAMPKEFSRLAPRIPLLTKWERDTPRDMQLTNGIVESFNAMCRPYRQMEPFAQLRSIYAIARAQIIQLRNQEGAYTSEATWMLQIILQQAGRMRIQSRHPDGTFVVQAGENSIRSW